MSLLYGRDATERIVGVVPHDDATVLIFKRFDDGSVRQYVEKSYTCFLTDHDGYIAAREIHSPEWGRGSHMDYELSSYDRAFYTHLILSKSRKDSRELYKYVSEKKKNVKSLGSTAVQYLMQTGRTLFKGMALSDVRRMQIDIETIAPSGGFPNADRAEDEIIAVAVSDNHGYRNVIHTSSTGWNEKPYTRLLSEPDLIRELLKVVLMRDPDIIEGHNFFGFDMPYILKRAKMHGIEFGIGRNRRTPYGRETNKKFAERDINFTNYVIAGRHIVDTMFLVIDYDVYKRDMPSHTLKASAKYFGLARKGRVYMDGYSITDTWLSNPNKVLEYSLDDVNETRLIAEKLLPATFELTKMVPSTLHQIHTSGVGFAIEGLFMREYLDQRHAVPEPEYGSQSFGGLAGVAMRGLIDDLLYIDVSSLYPSIMLNYGIRPDSDYLDIFQRLLSDLTNLRLKTKTEMNAESYGSDRYVELDAQQNAYKKIINSFYGALGYSRFAWNDISEADRVATTGQSILVRMMKVLETNGCSIVEVDTDGVICTRPTGVSNAKEFVKEVIEPKMPKGIKLDLDGEYRTMISYRPKNYALVDHKGNIKIKGGAFKNRSVERFLRTWMNRAIVLILEKKWNELRDSYDAVKNSVFRRELDVNDISVKKNLKIDIDTYEESVIIGSSNRQAQYEIWKKYKDRFDIGDPVYYYIRTHRRRKRAVISYLDAAHVDEYRKGTENVSFYLNRLETTSKKFSFLFPEPVFKVLFDPEPNIGQASMFTEEVPDLSEIACITEQVKSVEDFQKLLNANLAAYERLYTS